MSRDLHKKRIKRTLTIRGQIQRDRILVVATYLFWRKGYLGTSIQDIVDEANINKSNIYYYFKNKADILYQISLRTYEGVINVALSVMNSDSSPTKKLEEFIHGHIKWVLSNQVLAQLDSNDRRNLTPKLLNNVIESRDKYSSLFRKTVEDAMAHANSQVMDPKLASLFILSLMNSITLWYKPNAGLTPKEIASQVYSFVSNALHC